MWVTRWDFKSTDDVKKIFQNCKSVGVTDVFFQVRGRADAFYKSGTEPWGEELGDKPNFDPLKIAVDAAGENKLRIHAWMNVACGWGGLTEPKDKNHIWYKHPEWFALLKDGKKQKLCDHYNVLNLCDARVQDYLASVVEEVAANYRVDGIHLDYCRYVKDIHGDHPYNPGTLDEFKSSGKEDWNEFRTERLTALVTRIHDICKKHKLTISSAVVRTPERASEFHQDWAVWLKTGIVDFVVAMNYAKDTETFKKGFPKNVPSEKIIQGIGVLMHETADPTKEQIAACPGYKGWCLFAYSCFFESHKYFDKNPTEELRESRRKILR